MRLIIANDDDDWISKKLDIRAWAQRMLWFAKDNDVIVMMDPPDPFFVRYVSSLTGIDLTSIVFHVLPRGRFDGKLFDHYGMLNRDFIAAVARDVVDATEVIAAWPSPLVAEFVERIGLVGRWPGAGVFGQGAAEIFNSKANFRAFATAANVPISPGSVCRSKEAAILATFTLLAGADAVIAKTVLGGGGDGNHIFATNPDLAVGHSGSRYLTVASNTLGAITQFWDDQWNWASSSGAQPVVVEVYQPDCRTIYAEYDCAESGVSLGVIGELMFSERHASGDTVPIRNLGRRSQTTLMNESVKVAGLYWELGYRGPLSLDAIVGKNEQVRFTEANAQFTGSTHVYRIIYERIAGLDRQVTQVFAPPDWGVESVELFVSEIGRLGYAYNVDSRHGVIATTPKIGSGRTGPIAIAVVYERPSELPSILSELHSGFREARDRK